MILWPCVVSTSAWPRKILTPVSPRLADVDVAGAFWSAVVLRVGVTISVASSPAEKLTRPDCTRQAAVEASAEPPM